MAEQQEQQTQAKSDAPRKETATLKGIAALFEREELKDLFIKYLILIGVIEGFIFFVSFLSQLGPENVPFPWKSFFFAAFIVPLTITFLLGVIVLGFDRYLYGHTPADHSGHTGLSAVEQQSRIHKFHAVMYVIRQIPFLMGLLLLVVLSAVVYKLDVILAIIGHVGEQTAHYLSIALAVILGAGLIMGLVWMFMSYNLRKKSMEYQYQYKKDVVERTGLILLDDDRVMDQKGNLLTRDQVAQIPHTPQNNKDEDDEVILIE
ncbi:MAG: hypothetical protein JXR59_09510 [Desulfuromonadaceae bacterium]|nr:hypothetical protein [Desulfuromonadaceae bacterium]